MSITNSTSKDDSAPSGAYPNDSNNRTKCQLFIVYRGDIAQKLKDSGTLCPYRVNDKGNTEQIVEMFKGSDLIQENDEVRDLAETMILADCDKMGRVIHYA